MLLLTKLDHKKILINIESIKYIETVPDTIIFFLNGDSIMVRETLDEVSSAVVRFKAEVMSQVQSSVSETP